MQLSDAVFQQVIEQGAANFTIDVVGDFAAGHPLKVEHDDRDYRDTDQYCAISGNLVQIHKFVDVINDQTNELGHV